MYGLRHWYKVIPSYVLRYLRIVTRYYIIESVGAKPTLQTLTLSSLPLTRKGRGGTRKKHKWNNTQTIEQKFTTKKK